MKLRDGWNGTRPVIISARETLDLFKKLCVVPFDYYPLSSIYNMYQINASYQRNRLMKLGESDEEM